MMSTGKKPLGRPLVALLAVVAGWTGGRVMTWELPAIAAISGIEKKQFPSEYGAFSVDHRTGPQSLAGSVPFHAPPMVAAVNPAVGYMGQSQAVQNYAGMPWFWQALSKHIAQGGAQGSALNSGATRRGGQEPNELAFYSAGIPPFRTISKEFSERDTGQTFFAPEVRHNGYMTEGTPASQQATSIGTGQSSPAGPKRWSADTWALLREQGSAAPQALGILPATYGGSQAGAILRYRLRPESDHRQTLYMRTTSSMGLVQETSAALGLSARPFPKVPVIAAVEGRLTEYAGEYRLQPAVMAISELPWFSLPAGFRGEAYLQGGYIAGSFASLFADGQFRADQEVFQQGRANVRLGAGIWGGAQRDASRFDIGPSASITIPIGKQRVGKIGLDWRVRVAGDALPETGPALTLSAGF